MFDSAFDPPGRVEHRSFSWAVFLVAALVVGLVIIEMLRTVSRPRMATARCSPIRFPGWGWAGVALAIVAWVMAWGGESLSFGVRRYTFLPLWMGYILVVAAEAERRGAPNMLRRPEWLPVFIIGSLFWSSFEYLNRFSENWIYTGVPQSGLGDLLLAVLLPFSTVLPAVYVTSEVFRRTSWVGAFACCVRRPPPILRRPACGALLSLLGAAGIVAVGAWPTVAYPWMWLGPLCLTFGLMTVARLPHRLCGSWWGDHRVAVAWAAAGLLCGFFWELWNVASECRWTYEVSFVGWPRLFEMPLLGYAGYPVFGLLCALVFDLIRYATLRLPRSSAPNSQGAVQSVGSISDAYLASPSATSPRRATGARRKG